MAFLQWRRFNFFEKEFLENESNDPLAELAKSCQITCSSSGNGFLILGDSVGLISLVTRQHFISSFSAYKIAVTHCSPLKLTNVSSSTTNKSSNSKNKTTPQFHLATIGSDSDDLIPVLKIWLINETSIVKKTTEQENQLNGSQNQSEPKSPLAQCVRTIKLCHSSTLTQLSSLRIHSLVTSIDALSDTMLAIGFNDGHCLIIKGELTRESRSLRMKLLEVSTNDSVTNVAFATNFHRTINKQHFKSLISGSTSDILKQHITLFISTRKEICSYSLSSVIKDQEYSKFPLDSFGCEIGASCLKHDPKQQMDTIQFIVGRQDAIYFYNIDGRGPCLAYEGSKLFVTWFRNYLIVVTLNDHSTLQQRNQTLNDSATSSTSSVLSNPNPNLLSIYDISKKYIAYSSPIPAVSQIVSEWGLLYVITTTGRVLVFKECDIQTKLEILFKKNQFALAIDLAKTQTYSQDVLADMFKQYGDHLYRNGDFDGAIQQYCQTLGFLEPSYVIRKFLDLQRIHNLTTYLQQIHKQDLATEDHTTLLINCYVKLKDETKLNQFLKSSDLAFDVEIAIRVLRQAGYFDNAILLARRHQRYDSYFSILLEDKSDCRAVLDTFEQMLQENETEISEQNKKQNIIGLYLSKYGRMLMSDQPDRTTKLLKQLCLNYIKQMNNDNKSSTIKTDLEDLDSDLRNISNLDFNLDLKHKQDKNENNPERYLHIFLNHPKKFIEFLEFITAEWNMNVPILDESNQSAVTQVPMEISNTLLEMYLHDYKSEIKEDGLSDNRNKILSFLKDSKSNYDQKKAMILCQMSNFVPGILFLYEKSRMFKQILSYFINRRDGHNVLETCKKYADKEEPQLWIDALQYFSENYDENQKQNITFVIEKIDYHHLLPPLMVVEILSKPGRVTLGVVRSFLTKWIKTQQEQIDENEKLIDSYREECNRIQKYIDDIKYQPKVFQATKCAACSHVLELPSIHFMCNHSYHTICFESYIQENDQECPFCLPENRKIMNEISMYDNVKNINELFQKELQQSRDPFDVLSRFCGQGLFNPLTIVTDDGLITPSNSIPDCDRNSR